jgi:predicted XRE-type DNA-binding protein
MSRRKTFPQYAYPIQSRYVLKKKALKTWIYTHGHTQAEIAHKLGLSAAKFKEMLRERIPFKAYQIRRLVYMMGAQNAFQIIYFPTYQMRCKVWQDVFGKYRKKEKKYGRVQQAQKSKRSNTGNAYKRRNC